MLLCLLRTPPAAQQAVASRRRPLLAPSADARARASDDGCCWGERPPRHWEQFHRADRAGPRSVASIRSLSMQKDHPAAPIWARRVFVAACLGSSVTTHPITPSLRHRRTHDVTAHPSHPTHPATPSSSNPTNKQAAGRGTNRREPQRPLVVESSIRGPGSIACVNKVRVRECSLARCSFVLGRWIDGCIASPWMGWSGMVVAAASRRPSIATSS